MGTIRIRLPAPRPHRFSPLGHLAALRRGARRVNRVARRAPSGAAPLLLLGALSTFGPLAIDVYLPALPALATDLGVDRRPPRRS